MQGHKLSQIFIGGVIMSDIVKKVDDIENYAEKRHKILTEHYNNNKMKGPYDLTNEVIDKEIEKDRIGDYLLTKNLTGSFDNNIHYVGRSGVLITRLNQHVDDKEDYKRFKFCYAKDSEEAYKRECEDYHKYVKYGKLENKNHPDSPDGTDLPCPVDGCDHNKK